MQIARKASLGLALLGLVAGLAVFPKTASAQDLSGGNTDDPIVYAGTSYSPTFKNETNLTFNTVTVTNATVVFDSAPAGFNKNTDFTSTFTGPIVFQPFQTKNINPVSYIFSSLAPIGKYVLEVNLYGAGGKFLGQTQDVVDRLENGTATPEPSQTLALMIGAIGLGSLMLLRRRSNLRA